MMISCWPISTIHSSKSSFLFLALSDDNFCRIMCENIYLLSGVAPGIFRRGADASDEGANYFDSNALKPDRS